MTDPKDLQHYLDEKIRERNKTDRQAQQRADKRTPNFAVVKIAGMRQWHYLEIRLFRFWKRAKEP